MVEARPSFWLETVEIELEQQLEGQVKCDFAIIGGGFTGVTTAYFLKVFEPSCEVVLLEKEYIGFGASGRNAGFAMTLFGLTLELTALRFGKKNAYNAYKYMYDAVSLVKELVEKHSIDCDFEYNGFIRIATTKLYERRLKHEFEFAKKLGIEDAQWLEKNEIQSRINSPIARCGWYEKHCAILNPAKLIIGMKKVIKNLGVKIYEKTPIKEVNKISGKFEIKTEKGKVISEKILFATNAFSHLIPQIKRKQVPAFTHIVLTERLSENKMSEIGWKTREGLEDSRNLIHYFRLTKDNRLLMGGSDVSIAFGKNMNYDMNSKTFSNLEKFIGELFPPLKDVKIERKWGGPVSITVDLAPALGYVGDKNALYSLGCIGHGVSLTHMNGLTLAELFLEKKTERTSMFFVNRYTIPWPPEPIRFIVSHIIKGAMKLQDRIYQFF